MLDPSNGRWWQVDPMVDNMYDWSPYNYSFNNPIRYNDPKGDCPPGVDCGALASAIGEHINNNPDGVVAGATGFLLGLGNVAGNSISGLVNAVAHPIQTLDGLASLSTVEGQVTAGVNMAVAGSQKVDQFQNGTALDKGIVVGEVVGTVAELAVGTKGAGAMLKTSEAGTALKTLNKVDNLPMPKMGSAGGPGAGKAFSTAVKDAARAEANNKCTLCGTNTTRTAGSTQSNIDHAIPKSRGGNNTINNAQNTCRTCNQSKATQTTSEYLKKKTN